MKVSDDRYLVMKFREWIIQELEQKAMGTFGGDVHPTSTNQDAMSALNKATTDKSNLKVITNLQANAQKSNSQFDKLANKFAMDAAKKAGHTNKANPFDIVPLVKGSLGKGMYKQVGNVGSRIG